jgi:hypothetical protein
MALLRVVGDFFSDIRNFFWNLKLPLLLQGCPFCNSHFSLMFTYFKKIDVIVDSIDVVRKSIIIAVGVISKPPICCLDIISKSWLILDKLAKGSSV